MPSIEARLQRLEDIEAIRQLKADYAEACDDDHDPDRIVALFEPDAVWHQVPLEPCVGHAGIRTFMTALRESKRIRNSTHYFTNPNIVVEGDEAAGHWKLLMVYTGNVPDGSTQFHRIIGYYDEIYARQTNGRWLFRSLQVRTLEIDAYTVEDSKFD